MGAWAAEDGRIRSGWVVLVFGVLSSASVGGMSLPLALLDLLPRPGAHLDDPRVFFSSMMILGASALATLVCGLLMKAQVGLFHAGWAKRLALGAAMGAGALAVAAGLPPLLGHGTLALPEASVGRVALGALMQLVFLGPTGVGEELLTRGVPLHELARGTRPWAAVLITGGVFGLLHLGNPEASWVSTFNVALVGWWFGAAVLRSGSLWTGIGMHVAWNFCEGFVFGQPVSGVQPAKVALSMASWEPRGFWSGGDFGPEASGLTTVVLAVGLALTLLLPSGKGGPKDRGNSAPLP